MLLGLSLIIGGTDTLLVGPILLFCFFTLADELVRAAGARVEFHDYKTLVGRLPSPRGNTRRVALSAGRPVHYSKHPRSRPRGRLGSQMA